MKILSVKKGFECDHSSVTYQFVSEEMISSEIKALLKDRGVEFKTRKNTVSIHIPGEGCIPSEVQNRLLTSYNIPLLIYEEYDWWNFILMFDYDERLFQKLKRYETEDGDYTIHISKADGKIEVWATVELDYAQTLEGGNDLFKTLRELYLKVRDMILKDEFEPMDILFAYCSDEDLSKISPSTEVGKTLKSYLAR